MEYLYEKREYQNQFFNSNHVPEEVINFANQKGVGIDSQRDERIFRETFWELESRDLVVIGTSAPGGMPKLPWVSITEYGIKCYESGNILPYDPDRFLESLYRDVSNLDSIVKLYIEEAVSCFSNMNYLASVVMIGSALERNIIETTEVFYSKLTQQKTDFKKNILGKDKIKNKFDNFLKFLEDNGYKERLDRSAQEKLESLLPAIFNLIRITRNEAGHPTGREISKDEAEANILLAKEAIKFNYQFLMDLSTKI